MITLPHHSLSAAICCHLLPLHCVNHPWHRLAIFYLVLFSMSGSFSFKPTSLSSCPVWRERQERQRAQQQCHRIATLNICRMNPCSVETMSYIWRLRIRNTVGYHSSRESIFTWLPTRWAQVGGSSQECKIVGFVSESVNSVVYLPKRSNGLAHVGLHFAGGLFFWLWTIQKLYSSSSKSLRPSVGRCATQQERLGGHQAEQAALRDSFSTCYSFTA